MRSEVESTRRRHVRPARILLTTVALTACNSLLDVPTPTGQAGDRVLTTLTVNLAAPTIEVGKSTNAFAIGRDQNGAAMPIGSVTWSTQSPNVATVSQDGLIIGVGPGQSVISASSGGKSASSNVSVVDFDLLAACRLPAQFAWTGLGFPRVVNRLPSTGDVKINVVFVDFSDAPATRTPQEVFSIISPGAEQYYDAVSYGKMKMTFAPTYTWFRMSKPSTDYGWNSLTFAAHFSYIQEALVRAAPTSNYAGSAGFLVMSNPDAGALFNGPAFAAGPGFGVSVGGTTFENGATSGRDLLNWGALWANHELGHAMGLPDLYAYSGSAHRFVGGYSIMGLISGAAREHFAWERWLLGWVTDDQVTCAQPGVTTVDITPVERIGGPKMIVIPTGATTAVVVESRRREGFDTGAFNPGVLVYYIDVSIGSGAGVIQVLPINGSDSNKGSATLGVGQSLTFSGVTVTVVSSDATADRVEVRR